MRVVDRIERAVIGLKPAHEQLVPGQIFRWSLISWLVPSPEHRAAPVSPVSRGPFGRVNANRAKNVTPREPQVRGVSRRGKGISLEQSAGSGPTQRFE